MATTAYSKRKKQQRQAGLRIVILLAILICANMIAARFHYGLDLTKEKRFTLSPATKKLLRNMDGVAVIDVYLEGKFPAGFQRLHEATRERLQSFKEYGGNHILFRFMDPLEGKTENEKAAIYQQLSLKGVEPVNLSVHNKNDYTQQIIIPYAMVKYNGREMPVKLLETNMGLSDKEQLNNSESMLEFKFADAIHKMTLPDKPSIAYIIGNGENLGTQTFDALTTLNKYYKVDTFDVKENIFIPAYYSAVIINKPTLPFEDKEKFKIDQYVMSGGHVLWYIDMLNAPMDSLRTSQQFVTTEYGLNLDDQLFKYGVRVNANLIEDLACNQIPVIKGTDANNNPQTELHNWIYFPVFIPSSHHPIVNNMDAVMGVFSNSIDTIANPEIKKTILLTSSERSRVSPSPVRVTFAMMNFDPNPALFNKPFQPVAVLLEGKFKSLFDGRLPPQFLHILSDSLKRPFKPVADSAGSMIVISDGDMISNDFSPNQGPLEMGYWRFPPTRYANKAFFLNCLDYLTDNSGLLEARSKDMRLRLLDATRATDERTTWQFVNIGIPIILVLVFASAYLFFRKRRYEGKV
ncbi:gliding motility-associated ABC transporter substrate-binding protein GldG [Chitinophagaceae bacterium MMS25-I14]